MFDHESEVLMVFLTAHYHQLIRKWHPILRLESYISTIMRVSVFGNERIKKIKKGFVQIA